MFEKLGKRLKLHYYRRTEMKIYFFLLFILMICTSCVKIDEQDLNGLQTSPEYQPPLYAEMIKGYQARCDSLVDYFADHQAGHYMEVAACLYRQRNIDWALKTLDSLMQNPRGDMFWMYPFITVTFTGRDVLPNDTRLKMRELWRTYTPYRGDTENHWAMYYASLYLITQMYPDDEGDKWFNGRSSRENHQEARDYLISWMELTTRKGQGEFDSPDYYGVYIIPMAQLYAWSKDKTMKKRAAMMLDYLIADFAAENLNGLYVGGHSRTYPVQVLNQWKTSATGISWLLFGNTPYQPRSQAFVLALSGYRPPEILYHIANDRSEPYVHKELKRTRHRLRFSDERNAPVYKYTFMRKEYAMGCLQGGLLQPIQQHTWDITWAIDDPSQGYNTIFTVHPYSSGHELAMYFPEEIKLMTQAVVKSKGTYDSPDKWTSASPFEQVVQHRNALIVLYNIPKETRFPHISGFFPKSLKRSRLDDSGWIFCDAGKTFIAYFPLNEYEWQEEENNWRLFSAELKNGAVVQADVESNYNSFKEFQRAILKLALSTKMDSLPSVDFTSLDGTRMQFTYDRVAKINGSPVNYNTWKLFDGPFLYAERNSQRLQINYKSMHRLLDFKNITVKEWIDSI
jgi:hypothetical protein